jgi:NAD(P)H-dependent flavin oxidoreductase YrpB (nitropropane dioxygenase family)
VTTMAPVPRVVDAVAPAPVAAAGGISDARGLVAAHARTQGQPPETNGYIPWTSR